MNDKQHALAAEIRAEAAAQQITAKDMQTAIGVSSSAWSNYFVARTRDVPMSVVVAVAEVLGMTASELLRRAEARASVDPASVSRTRAELEAGLTRSGRRALEQARKDNAERLGPVADPFGRTRADQDDGSIGRTG
jgi:hypothetical protein